MRHEPQNGSVILERFLVEVSANGVKVHGYPPWDLTGTIFIISRKSRLRRRPENNDWLALNDRAIESGSLATDFSPGLDSGPNAYRIQPMLSNRIARSGPLDFELACSCGRRGRVFLLLDILPSLPIKRAYIRCQASDLLLRCFVLRTQKRGVCSRGNSPGVVFLIVGNSPNTRGRKPAQAAPVAVEMWHSRDLPDEIGAGLARGKVLCRTRTAD